MLYVCIPAVCRWLSLNYNTSAVSLSSCGTRLLVALSARIQEVELVQGAGGGVTRQLHLPATLHLGALDPVTTVREVRPSLATLALTRQVAAPSLQPRLPSPDLAAHAQGRLLHVSWSGAVTRLQLRGLVASYSDPATGAMYLLGRVAGGMELWEVR